MTYTEKRLPYRDICQPPILFYSTISDSDSSFSNLIVFFTKRMSVSSTPPLQCVAPISSVWKHHHIHDVRWKNRMSTQYSLRTACLLLKVEYKERVLSLRLLCRTDCTLLPDPQWLFSDSKQGIYYPWVNVNRILIG